MQILGYKLSRQEFAKYLKTKKFGSVAPNELVIHHTWKPTVESWNGKKSIEGLKRFYERKKWSAGPHIFIAEDGIWLFTDMAEVGVHAGEGNATWEKGGKIYRGYNFPGARLEGYSIGIEVVGNYDEKVWEGATLKNALFCISALRKNLGISLDDIRFHREFSNKSCPGNAITREWFEDKLTEFEAGKKTSQGYEFQFSPEEAEKAIKLGFLKQVDSETREIIAIGLVRVYERLKKDFEKKKVVRRGVRRNKKS